ncbi:MAG: T9SS C-terminal target domain-containing protein [Bacteroidetes bacterium]|nr:MAG: T9SS C-terminal target domain-containing protein [Bacteroidota bacterium]
MKKLVLLVSLLQVVAFLGFSQNLSLIHDGTPVPNNGAVTYTGEPTTTTIEAHIGVTNNGSVTLSVKCKKEEISLIPNSINAFCWGACYEPEVYVSLFPLDIAPGVTSTEFIGEYQPVNNAGQSVIRYTFYDEKNPNDSVCFQALYNAYPLGIESHRGSATLSNAYPNPANTQATFRYAVERDANAVLLVRNLLGSTMAEEVLTGSGEVRISTRDLSEGIYFYSLQVNGQTQSTRKLVVSH